MPNFSQPDKPKPKLPALAIKERRSKDPGILDLVEETMDPTRWYRWCRCRADENMTSVAQTKLHGYRVEYHKEGGVQTYAETDARPDKAIVIGDLILMSTPKINHETRQEDRFQRQEAILNSLTVETEEMARDKGISIIKDADHNSKRSTE